MYFGTTRDFRKLAFLEHEILNTPNLKLSGENHKFHYTQNP